MNYSDEKFDAILRSAERYKRHPSVMLACSVVEKIERLNTLLSKQDVGCYLQKNEIAIDGDIHRAESSALALIGQLLVELDQPSSESADRLASLVSLLQELGENISLLVEEVEGIALLLESRSNA